MSLQEEIEALSKVPLFARLDVAKIKLLAFTADREKYEEGQSICVEGEEGDKAFIILSGKAQVWVKTNAGPLHVSDLGQNDIIGEVSLLSPHPRSATVIVEKEVDALVLNEDVFMHMVQEFPDVGVELMRALAEKLHVTTLRLQDVANDKVTK